MKKAFAYGAIKCIATQEAPLKNIAPILEGKRKESDMNKARDKILLINENKSNNFDVKSNNELFKQAINEGLSNKFDKTIEEAKKIEQIEEMAKIICGVSDCGICPDDGCEDCITKRGAKALYNAGYRKQSEGEWIDRYKGKYANSLYVCSICDGKSLLVNHMNELLTPTVKQILTPYCPHCGAKMKGGEE